MAPFAARTGGSAGFSLIEVLAALVIAGLALSAISQVFGAGLLARQVNTDAGTALTLAEGEIASVGAATPLRPGRSRGNFAGRFIWQLDITPYHDIDDEDPAASTPSSTSLGLYRIAITVSWRDGPRRRQVTLSTLRLGAASP